MKPYGQPLVNSTLTKLVNFCLSQLLRRDPGSIHGPMLILAVSTIDEPKTTFSRGT